MLVEQFLCRQDNIALLLHDETSKNSIAIDAPDAEMLLAALEKAGRNLAAVLITHHHRDHTDGIARLKQAAGARIYAPQLEAGQIAGTDKELCGGAQLRLGGAAITALATPGHTLGSLSYYLPQENMLFSGDSLFSLGCGRIFEGDALMMFKSLQKLAALPPQTRLYCGHEYSAANARFALSVEPQNQALQRRALEIAALRAADKLTLPATIGAERAENPFLRCDSAEIRARLGCAASVADSAVFARLRRLKDEF